MTPAPCKIADRHSLASRKVPITRSSSSLPAMRSSPVAFLVASPKKQQARRYLGFRVYLGIERRRKSTLHAIYFRARFQQIPAPSATVTGQSCARPARAVPASVPPVTAAPHSSKTPPSSQNAAPRLGDFLAVTKPYDPIFPLHTAAASLRGERNGFPRPPAPIQG